jgi:hypothetical protein
LAELTLYSFLSAAWIGASLHDLGKLAEVSGIAMVAFFWLRHRRLRDWAHRARDK